MSSLGLYLVLIIWSCSVTTEINGISLPIPNTIWNVQTVDESSPELAKRRGMRAFMDAIEEQGNPLDSSCQLKDWSATEIPIETLRRVVRSRDVVGSP